ncbi:SMP-30/gluconolactonase/LRE family protein [Streptomyces sp. RGM 3693]|uniref:SMP-30/gluconolactonase/LRE family protein n=1 Tax=Streptomyces sp. RGM 3693 TaxID=3413284 RepID=UPI003D2E70F9
MTKVVRLAGYSTSLGESPRWLMSEQRLAWVDIYVGTVYIRDHPAGVVRSIELGEPVGCLAETDVPGRYLCAVQSGLVVVGLDGYRKRIAEFSVPGHRLNDGGCDPSGRFWVGSMSHGGTGPTGELFRLCSAGRLEPVEAGLTISNGLAWDIDRARMYHVDSTTQRLDVFDWDPHSGTAANRQPFFSFPAEQGSPDGIAVDSCGTVWVALWGGGCVIAVGADGAPGRRIELPTQYVTACAFGGEDLRTMFITTATGDWPDFALASDSDAGGVYSIRLPDPGVPATPFPLKPLSRESDLP